MQKLHNAPSPNLPRYPFFLFASFPYPACFSLSSKPIFFLPQIDTDPPSLKAAAREPRRRLKLWRGKHTQTDLSPQYDGSHLRGGQSSHRISCLNSSTKSTVTAYAQCLHQDEYRDTGSPPSPNPVCISS